MQLNRPLSWRICSLFFSGALGLVGLVGCGTAPGSIPGTGSSTNTNVIGESGLVSGASGSGGGTVTPSASATVLEQVALERINRARLRPAQEASNAGIAIDEGVPGQLDTTPKQPLAMNASLRSAARKHSEDMLQRNYFDHDSPEGVSPFDRMQAEGFSFTTAGENLAWMGTTGALDPVATVDIEHDELFVDTGIAGRGHRVTMLNTNFREVGVGIVRGSFTRQTDGTVFSDSIMQTQDYGTSPSDAPIVLGVIYEDNNSNGQYDSGEGVGNVRVSLDDVAKTTNEAGGYSFVVGQLGTLELEFANGRTQTINIGPGDPNIKVDLVNGIRVVINLGLGALN